jgi:hypothetical protein
MSNLLKLSRPIPTKAKGMAAVFASRPLAEHGFPRGQAKRLAESADFDLLQKTTMQPTTVCTWHRTDDAITCIRTRANSQELGRIAGLPKMDPFFGTDFASRELKRAC